LIKHQVEAEAKMRDAAIRKKEAEVSTRETEARRKEEEVHRRESEASLLEEKARQALEEFERLQVGARQAEASAKIHEAVAQQKELEAMARYKEAEAKKLELGAQDRESGTRRKDAEANKKEDTHCLEEKVRRSLMEADRRIRQAEAAKTRNDQEFRKLQERSQALDVLENELRQKLADAREQEKNLQRRKLAFAEIEKLQIGGSNRISQESMVKNSASSKGRNYDFFPDSIPSPEDLRNEG
jgi:hypothetical protein